MKKWVHTEENFVIPFIREEKIEQSVAARENDNRTKKRKERQDGYSRPITLLKTFDIKNSYLKIMYI